MDLHGMELDTIGKSFFMCLNETIHEYFFISYVSYRNILDKDIIWMYLITSFIYELNLMWLHSR